MAKTFEYQTKLKSNKCKYGIQFPTGYSQDIELYKYNGNSLWQDAVKRGVGQIKIFEILNPMKSRAKYPKGCQIIPIKLVFYIKFHIRRKVRLVAGGHCT